MKTTKTLLISFAITASTCSIGQTMTDVDGNEYRTTSFNGHVIMAENYMVTHFRNGDPILFAKKEEDWIEAAWQGRPAYCEIEGGDSEHSTATGYLYNWYAIYDPRGFAPEGWHVPTRSELTNMLKSTVKGNVKWECHYGVVPESWKTAQKRAKKEEINIESNLYKLFVNASGYRDQFGNYRYPDHGYIMIREHLYVMDHGTCCEFKKLGIYSGEGFPVRLVKDE